MSNVLVVNAGSSSLKLALLGPAGDIAASLNLDHWDGQPDHHELRDFLTSQREVAAVGHRVVHGGADLTRATIIDEHVLTQIKALTDLAPLHQPRALAAIAAARSLLPQVPHVACFDTAFHATLPAAARAYALPAAWTERYGLRRYGFHGLSHAYAARRCAQLLEKDPQQLRVVTCHLGAGSSLAAVSGGISVDTTMGFTPLDGLVMATRPGSVDPGLLLWLLARGDLTLDQVSDGLEHAAGLAGLAALPDGSGDLREVRAAADAGSATARLAVDVHARRLRREIAAMAAAMDGLDALVFTGGIGEHQPQVRAEAAAGLGFLGVAIDPVRNRAAAGDGEITAALATVRTLVVAAREDLEIARQVRAVLNQATDPRGGIMTTVTTSALAAQPFLRGMPPAQLDALARLGQHVSIPAGQRLFEEGTTADQFWIIDAGQARLDASVPGRGPVTIETLGRNDVVGLSWMHPPYQWRFGATATQPMQAYAFDARAVRAACDADPVLGYELSRRFFAAVTRRLQATRARLLEASARIER